MSENSPELTSATAMKLATAKQKKDTGDQAFKLGETKAALLAYHEASIASDLLSRSSSAPTPSKDGKEVKEKTEVDEILEKIYANMSACHIKNQNWQRAVDTANKALAKNENNYKAMFRKGKALGEQGFFEKAVKILEEVKEKNPSDKSIVDAELTRLRAIDNERERANKQKLKGFLNKAEKKAAAVASSDASASTTDPA
ncbi:Tetratricopeptide repeat protein 9B [Hypsizygus marmoreus]|uniref:Tetratricopeptide repeat protein 9B n=1 Tax=Hypsizygus marmoreus TaxID=39966 RepID=A0A369K287_HYPMA|nr:Tetratricopeptide repeat protein 9B [Hypsizygus marmoreus]